MSVEQHPAIAKTTEARTLGQMFLRAASRDAAPALRWREGDRWAELTYAQLAARARELARGLIALGIEPGDRVAILSNTRPEWTLADAGSLCAAATVVPVYHTNSPGECQYVLEHAEARAIFCEDGEQVAKIARIRERCPALEHVIVLTGEAPGAITLDELRVRGAATPAREVDDRVAAVEPETIATLVYTSGTTGPPKGCMLTHENWTTAVEMYARRLELSGGTFFLFLPLAHVFARIIQMVAVDTGATLSYWQRDPQRILDDLREANPTHFPSVPRLFEKIYTAAQVGIAAQSPVKRVIFNWAIRSGAELRRREHEHKPAGPWLRLRNRIGDRLVLSKVRALFGDNLDFAISGAAPIAADVLAFFNAAGVKVLEGYGMTETTAGGAINTLGEWRVGTIGRPLPPGELRVADDGELLWRAPYVFRGYYKNPVATAETVVDGWLHSGDLGSVDEDGFVHITGRKKDIIITSSGKNITPTNIENALKESRWISEAVVYGDDRPYLVALITLDADEVPALAEKVGMEPDVAAMAGDDRVRAEIQCEVDAANERFARIEQIKRFTVLQHDLTQEAGEMTPTLKVKRRAVYSKYANDIAALYE